MIDYSKLKEAIGDLDEDTVLDIVNKIAAAGDPQIETAVAAFQKGLEIVGDRFESGEYFVGDLIFAGDLMSGAFAKLKPLMAGNSESRLGKMVLCTVAVSYTHLDVYKRQQLIGVNIINSTKQLRFELQINEEVKLIRIKRLFCSTKNPVSYDVKYIPYKRGEPIIEKEIRFANFPELVAQRTSLFTVNKELKIYCDKATPEIGELLQIEENMPVVVVKQKFFDGDSKPLGLGFTYINPLWFSLQASSFNKMNK